MPPHLCFTQGLERAKQVTQQMIASLDHRAPKTPPADATAPDVRPDSAQPPPALALVQAPPDPSDGARAHTPVAGQQTAAGAAEATLAAAPSEF